MTDDGWDDNVRPFPKPGGLLRLSKVPNRDPLKPWYSGFPEWQGKVAIAPGTLLVVTGSPGHGKTALVNNVVFNTAKSNDLQVIMAAFENEVKPDLRKMLRQYWAGCRQDEMTDRDILEADGFIEEHYRFIVHPDDEPTLSYVLDMAQSGISPDILVIDPWNGLLSERNESELETEYIGAALTGLRAFAVRENCCVIITAHPAKRDVRFRDRMPTLEDVSGSKNWDNKPDQGWVLYRPEFWDKNTRQRRFDVEFHQLKARHEELGYVCQIPMRLNPKTCRFECA